MQSNVHYYTHASLAWHGHGNKLLWKLPWLVACFDCPELQDRAERGATQPMLVFSSDLQQLHCAQPTLTASVKRCILRDQTLLNLGGNWNGTPMDTFLPAGTQGPCLSSSHQFPELQSNSPASLPFETTNRMWHNLIIAIAIACYIIRDYTVIIPIPAVTVRWECCGDLWGVDLRLQSIQSCQPEPSGKRNRTHPSALAACAWCPKGQCLWTKFWMTAQRWSQPALQATTGYKWINTYQYHSKPQAFRHIWKSDCQAKRTFGWLGTLCFYVCCSRGCEISLCVSPSLSLSGVSVYRCQKRLVDPNPKRYVFRWLYMMASACALCSWKATSDCTPQLRASSVSHVEQRAEFQWRDFRMATAHALKLELAKRTAQLCLTTQKAKLSKSLAIHLGSIWWRVFQCLKNSAWFNQSEALCSKQTNQGSHIEEFKQR